MKGGRAIKKRRIRTRQEEIRQELKKTKPNTNMIYFPIKVSGADEKRLKVNRWRKKEERDDAMKKRRKGKERMALVESRFGKNSIPSKESLML